jgi:hypothetical protein
MGLILGLALAFAALRNANDYWAGGMLLSTPLLIATADPFGLDGNDLPTGAIAEIIREDTIELLGLTCPPQKDVPAPCSKVF